MWNNKDFRLDKKAVENLIPHRKPFLLVDSAEIVEAGRRIRAEVYVSPGWEVFKGHFPGNPVLPGVYAIESAGQAAVLLVMDDDRHKGKIPFLYGADNVRFFKPVRPGDTMHIIAEMMNENTERALIGFHCEAYVEDVMCSCADITVAIR